MNISSIKSDLSTLAQKDKINILQGFFKTGKGEYGEGDIFIGVTVPDQRNVAKNNKAICLSDLSKLLESPIHEHRLTALLILTYKYPKSNPQEKEKIKDYYLAHTKYVNNWDLVDLSAPNILGTFTLENPNTKATLFKLSKSKSIWEKRIAMLATYPLIKQKQFAEALKIAETLLLDDHDLIHKAVGWMLREIGKLDQETEELFLKKHYRNMPRTTLRYAIERFSDAKRKFYLKKD